MSPRIANFFRKRRLALERTYREMAAACGVTESCIRNWEIAHSAPSARQTADLARAYEVKFDEMAIEIARAAVLVARRGHPAAA